MKRTRDAVLAALALAACTGPPAGGQVSPAVRGEVRSPNVYEIAPEQVAPEQEAGFIEVSGSGTVTLPSDRARVAFAVETRAPTAAGASAANAGAMDAVLAAIRRGSFEGLEIETFGYSLRPEYANVPNQRTREITAYVALNNVQARVSDVDAVGRLIDAAIGAGANRVAHISFMASDTDEAESEALARAVRDARAQAEVIARTLGHELGPALEVRGGSQRPVPIQTRGAMMALEAQAAPTPIEAGDQTVTATVSIRFALGRELGG